MFRVQSMVRNAGRGAPLPQLDPSIRGLRIRALGGPEIQSLGSGYHNLPTM